MISLLPLTVREDRRSVFEAFSPARAQPRVRDLWVRFTEAHRQRRILGLIGLLWFFGAFDLVLTLWADRFTIFYEANPIARAMLANGMIKSVVGLKFITLSLGSVVFWWTRHRRWTEGVLWALASGYVVLMFQWSAYTANADELMHYRQMADFAATPISEDPAYFLLVRRAREAERAHAAAASARAHAAVLTLASAQRSAPVDHAWSEFVGSAASANRLSKPLQGGED